MIISHYEVWVAWNEPMIGIDCNFDAIPRSQEKRRELGQRKYLENPKKYRPAGPPSEPHNRFAVIGNLGDKAYIFHMKEEAEIIAKRIGGYVEMITYTKKVK